MLRTISPAFTEAGSSTGALYRHMSRSDGGSTKRDYGGRGGAGSDELNRLTEQRAGSLVHLDVPIRAVSSPTLLEPE